VTNRSTRVVVSSERNFNSMINIFQHLLITEPETKFAVIIDEFDIFVESQRQTFIYSLLECLNIKPQKFSLIAISSRLVQNRFRFFHTLSFFPSLSLWFSF
jgi:hypothetical protein